MDVMSYLRDQNVSFEHMTHPEVYTAQEVAAAQHVPGHAMAKAVLVKADDKPVMAVLSAIYRINFDKLAKALGAKVVTLADESDMKTLFADAEVGAEAPFGNMYDIDTIVDEHLAGEEEIVFQAGTHTDTVKIAYKDYEGLANPIVAEFGDHV
jgi:Ala-tRNA(Pro) deacylase